MTIDKAIEILNTHQAQLAFDNAPDLRSSINLGIEALKAIKLTRKYPRLSRVVLLAGES